MDRKTFNSKVTICWQKQLRDYYLDEGVPKVDLDLKKARVIPVSREFAEQIILKYEWLGTMANTQIHYGIFFQNYCAGVTCIGIKGNGFPTPYIGKEFGIAIQDMVLLARGACVHWAPPGTNSKLVSFTCKLLKNYGKLILAYADTDAGEIGTIYQSCNWYYIGKSEGVKRKDASFITPAGKILHKKTLNNKAKSLGIEFGEYRKILKDQGFIEQRGNPKHRYVQILDKTDKELIAKIKAMSKPYPKRPKQANLSDQERSGGATPTRTLQKMTQPILSLDLFNG